MVPSPGTGLVWCNDGITDKRFNPSEIPTGWTRGRLRWTCRDKDDKGRFKKRIKENEVN